jgi:hypothetical protein
MPVNGRHMRTRGAAPTRLVASSASSSAALAAMVSCDRCLLHRKPDTAFPFAYRVSTMAAVATPESNLRNIVEQARQRAAPPPLHALAQCW